MNLLTGLAFFFVSAIFNGLVGLPLRIRRRFEVENTWTAGNLFGMVIFPAVSAFLILSPWFPVLRSVELKTLAILTILGFGWGTGSVAYAMGVAAIGMGVGMSTIFGIIIAVGAGVPLMRRWEEIPPWMRWMVIAGIVIAIVGVAVVGLAGVRREAKEDRAGGSSQSGLSPHPNTEMRAYVLGLIWCLVSGVTSACANIGFDLAAPLGKAAVSLGANPIFGSLFRWIPLFMGGYLAVLAFSGSKLITRRTWRNFFGPSSGRDFALAVFLGVCMFGTLITYGVGTAFLGVLGTSVGYAISMSMAIVVANALGFLTGEWKGASRRAQRTLFVGLGVLIFAVVLLAVSNSLVT